MPSVFVAAGDCRESLSKMQDSSVDCVVTSPPYWLQRDYGFRDQIGQEETPEKFVESLCLVFKDVFRVLSDTGTCWLNMGDTYQDGDLVGIPWMLAFALKKDGWILRQDIIWQKPNPMPEPVTSRCVKSHEYVFLLSKQQSYFFDHIAIQEPSEKTASGNTKRKDATARGIGENRTVTSSNNVAGSIPWAGDRRNKRSVWTVSPAPIPGSHHAVMPLSLAEMCVKAGCPENGTVLDPFAGSGTTAVAATVNGRHAVLCEGNPEYVRVIESRLKTDMYVTFAEAPPCRKPAHPVLRHRGR